MSLVPIVVAIALGVFLLLSWLFWRRGGGYIAPGIGAVGGGTAMVAVGGLLVAKGHSLAGLVLDAVGAVSIWAAFQTRGQ